ncbi:2628_t:CDS:2, partial [Acaulospora morrowiae]
AVRELGKPSVLAERSVNEPGMPTEKEQGRRDSRKRDCDAEDCPKRDNLLLGLPAKEMRRKENKGRLKYSTKSLHTVKDETPAPKNDNPCDEEKRSDLQTQNTPMRGVTEKDSSNIIEPTDKALKHTDDTTITQERAEEQQVKPIIDHPRDTMEERPDNDGTLTTEDPFNNPLEKIRTTEKSINKEWQNDGTRPTLTGTQINVPERPVEKKRQPEDRMQQCTLGGGGHDIAQNGTEPGRTSGRRWILRVTKKVAMTTYPTTLPEETQRRYNATTIKRD